VDNSEKVGGISRPESQMEGFREAIRDCGMGDLGFKGSNTTKISSICHAQFDTCTVSYTCQTV
jgi:hypothetical protein